MGFPRISRIWFSLHSRPVGHLDYEFFLERSDGHLVVGDFLLHNVCFDYRGSWKGFKCNFPILFYRFPKCCGIRSFWIGNFDKPLIFVIIDTRSKFLNCTISMSNKSHFQSVCSAQHQRITFILPLAKDYSTVTFPTKYFALLEFYCRNFFWIPFSILP